MKQSLILFVLLLVGITATQAQRRLTIGPRAGVNFVKIEGSEFKDQFNWGYQLGGGFEFALGKNKTWGIGADVLWNQTNVKTGDDLSDVTDAGLNSLTEAKLNYLQIPILLTWRPTKLIGFQAGPSFGVKINEEKTLLENGGEAFRNGDFGLIGGAQVYLGALRVYGRYNVGLSDLSDVTNTDQWRSQTLTVGLGIMF